jgi:uncharacterized protein (DUF1778 family)
MTYAHRMPKRRDGIMTVRIPTDEKDLLQAIADQADVTLSDVVVRAVRDFIEANQGSLKKGAPKPKVRPLGF